LLWFLKCLISKHTTYTQHKTHKNTHTHTHTHTLSLSLSPLSTQASHNSKPHPFHSTFRIPKKLTPLLLKKTRKTKVHNKRGPKMVIHWFFFFFFFFWGGFRFCRLFAVCSVKCSAVCALSAASNSVVETRSPTRQRRASRLASSPPRRAWQRAIIINYRCPLFSFGTCSLSCFLARARSCSLIFCLFQEFVPELTSSESSS
jgi:hypothetical protein